MKLASVVGAGAGLGLLGLCQCSVFFDLGALDNGSDSGDDAATPGPTEGGSQDDGGDNDAGDDGDGTTTGPPDSSGNGSDGSDGRGGVDASNDRDANGGGSDASEGGGGGDDGPGPVESGSEGGPDTSGVEAGDDGGGNEAAPPDASDGGLDLTAGLIAYYPFDETSGTTSADATGNGNTATLAGNATFVAGLQGNAVALNGTNQYVTVPNGIVAGLTSVSIATWVKLTPAADGGAPARWVRIFDFGIPATTPTSYMFLSPNAGGGLSLRFAITTGGNAQEQQLNAAPPALGTWQHVAVTLGANTGTLYVNGAQSASAGITLNPSSLGTTTQNWIGRSAFTVDPYLAGQIDNFRIYNRALSLAEVQQLVAQHL